MPPHAAATTQPPIGPPIAQLTGVGKRFGDVEALRDDDLTIPAGVVGLLGPNGAGKTTLLRILMGLEGADTGEVAVLGRSLPYAALEVRARLGYMPEDDCLFPDLDGIGQVVHAGKLCGMKHVDAFARAHECLDLCGISEARHRPASGYSLGMRQRLRLAMAIVHGPMLVLLDEPTAGLDPAGREEMLGLVGEIAAAGTSVLLSTHVLADVESVCDQVVLLSRGRPGFSGPVEKFTARSAGDRWQLEVVGDRDAFIAALAKAGIRARREGHLLLAELSAVQHRLLWRVAADNDVGLRGFWPADEAIGDAFLRHLGLDDPARPRASDSASERTELR